MVFLRGSESVRKLVLRLETDVGISTAIITIITNSQLFTLCERTVLVSVNLCPDSSLFIVPLPQCLNVI